MAGKAAVTPPIDRPLARAYLREFTGWSTAYPPGLSDPSSLRLMENAWITREGALRIRPALRSVLPDGNWLTTNFNISLVGSFETFFLNNGDKALLLGVRESDGTVGFRVAQYLDPEDPDHSTDPSVGRYQIQSLEQAGFTVTDGLPFAKETTYIRYIQIDNRVLALSDTDEPMRIFQVGETKTARAVTPLTNPAWDVSESINVCHPNATWINGAQNTLTSSQTPTTATLISSDATKNTYSYGFFYTLFNEVGETAPSQMTVLKAQRPWSQWILRTPDANGDPNGTAAPASKPVTDPSLAADQFVAMLPASVYTRALSEKALGFRLYMLTWSSEDTTPVEGVLVYERDFTATGTSATESWARMLALQSNVLYSSPLPDEAQRINYSDPSRAAQGLVAGDRVILVNDKSDGAKIRWSSNQVGEYTNFSSNQGGGYKTLTSGNLYIPACVKLWQNPQSVDTLTVLCMGVDGYSTSYYMAPNSSVSGQSQSTTFMGFEETTATPGTVSPYGCEVVNQGLYHPLDALLMKSTAANYMINHKSMTDVISNKWLELLNKQNIVSSTMDNRIYYIVYNPDGEDLETGCMGNEIWVIDVGNGGTPTWSRWLIQGIALRTLKVGDKLYMALSRPESIFIFDELSSMDQYSNFGETSERPIKWSVETNTQGTNRAHDQWANLQQVNVTFGSTTGTIRYGIRGYDVNGFPIEMSKTFRDLNLVDYHSRPMPFDQDDYFQIRKQMKEWRLFFESVPDPDSTSGDHLFSYGQINLVQYRHSPISVNVGYEYGSTETFEYTRAGANWSDRLTDGGTPMPYLDTRRP